MSIVIADRVKETSTTTGTGTLSLAGAATGFQGFVAGAGDGAEVYYCIAGGSEWETGIGTVTDASPDTLSRDTVLASSNAGSLVNFSAGTKDVFLTVPSAWYTRFGVLHVRDEKSNGTHGGAASATTWNTRVLNTVVVNQITGASLSSNQVTLPAGTYRVRARAPGYLVDQHRLGLYNVDDSQFEVLGGGVFNVSGTFIASDAHIIGGRFTIAAEKTLELRHYTDRAQGTDGLGYASSSGQVEIYAELWIEQEA